jgi:4-amino-4-deoxy-L-arabinose transferase-like glycosyltransferase
MASRLSIKRFSIGRNEIVVLALIIAATLLRFILIALHWPVTNSDEGNMGILARHVAYNGEWPTFFYGLPYMGPIEGYLAAPLFHLFGPSTFTLRLALLPFYLLFLLCVYFTTRLLYTPRFALFSVLLLCFGSDEVISRQLKAVGEYPEILFFAAAIMLIVTWLAFTSHTVPATKRTTLPRLLLYELLGLLVGIALWVDFLILPFVGTAIVLLLLFCRRELLSIAGLSAILGIIIGAFPLIRYNLTAPTGANSLQTLIAIHQAGGHQHFPLLQQLVGAFLISLPDATSLSPQCPSSAFPYFGTTNWGCIALHGVWSLGYLALLVVATALAGMAVYHGWKKTSLLKPDWTVEQRQMVIRQCARLMVLISAIGTLLIYVGSPLAASTPGPTARYLTCLLVALPATLWPLWQGISNRLAVAKPAEQTANKVGPSLVVQVALLLLIFVVFFAGTIRTCTEIPAAQDAYNSQEALVQRLQQLGATRIYSEYWTCNRLIFQSGEKIICSALGDELQSGFNRYTPYAAEVAAAAHPAYVFPLGSAQAAAFAHRLEAGGQPRYRHEVYQNYDIYVPIVSS